MRAQVAAGVGRSHRMAVSVFIDSGTMTEALSVDSLHMKVFGRDFVGQEGNLAATGSVRLVVQGSSMAVADYTTRLRAATASEQTHWLSTSSVHSRSASGATPSQRILITLGVTPSSRTISVSTDIMTVNSAVGRANSPTTGNVQVTVIGANIGVAALTSKARHMASAAEATLWLSDTCIAFGTPQGTLRRKLLDNSTSFPASVAAVITVAERLGETRTRAFSIDVPSVHHARNATNGPNIPYVINMTTTTVVYDSWGNASNFSFHNHSTYYAGSTVRGADLGITAYSLRAHVQQSVSVATFWQSDTSITCRFASGSGGSLRLSVTVATSHVVSTGSELFSFDGPLLRPRSCMSMLEHDSSLLQCWGLPLAETWSSTFAQRKSEPLPCNQNDPTLPGRQCTSQNTPTTGAVLFSVSGRAWGVVGSSPAAHFVAPTAAEATMWTSDSALRVRSPAGAGLATSSVALTGKPLSSFTTRSIFGGTDL
jgi:hypothetical protein